MKEGRQFGKTEWKKVVMSNLLCTLPAFVDNFSFSDNPKR